MGNAQNEQANVQNEHISELEQLREGESEQMQIRREKLQKIYDLGLTPFGQKFDWTHHNQQIIDEFADLEDQQVAIAGRIMAIRDHGKTAFLNLRDFTGDIQVYLRQDEVSELEYQLFQLLDIGDIVGINGKVFKTHKGEITVRVEKLTLLSKGLRPLPNKWQGLKDPEIRYRQRYVDLIMNPQVRDTFKKRSQIINCIREWLTDHGFMEVETPMMQTIYGGAAARPFITHHNAHNMDVYMRISPELYLKRLVVGGFERVFEINRNFRNEGVDRSHSPEFAMLETYAAWGDYNDCARMTRESIQAVARDVFGSTTVTLADGTEFDFGGEEWPEIEMYPSLNEALQRKFPGQPEVTIDTDVETLKGIADVIGLDVPKDGGWGHGKLVEEIWEVLCEDQLEGPIFVKNFPVETSPLTRQHRSEPGVTEKWDLYVRGFELATGYSELVDPVIQRERFEDQARLAAGGDDEAMVLDEDFLAAMEQGMPPTAGTGMGMDRLLMALTGLGIRETVLFPLVKPEQK